MANEFKIKKGLIVTGATGGTVVDIQGSLGQLMSVTDNLTGSIFSASDISGIPIFDVNSTGLVTVDGNLTLKSANPILKIDASGTGNPEIFFTRLTSDDQNARIVLGSNQLRFENEGDPDGTFLFQGRAAGSGSLSDFLKIEDTGITTTGGDFTGTILGKGSGGITVNNGTGGTTSKLLFLNTDNNDGSAFIRKLAYFMQFGSNQNEGFKFTDIQNSTQLLQLNGGNSTSGNGINSATFFGKAYGVTPVAADSDVMLATKGYVNQQISGGANYLGVWVPDNSLNSGYGNPSLAAAGRTDDSGDYFICSTDGGAHPNGGACEPDSWKVGDWVVWNNEIVDCAGTGTGTWQKIDNSSVLSGIGNGSTVALWEGASGVTDSEVLGNAPITISGNNSIFAGNILIPTGKELIIGTQTSAGSPLGITIRDDQGNVPVGMQIHNEDTNSGADAQIAFETQGAMDFSIGIDRSDSNKFVMSRAGALGTNNVFTIDGVAATFSTTITSGVLTVGSSGTSRLTDTSAFPLQLNRGLDTSVVGTNGVVLGLGSYSTGTTYVDAARIAANLESATSGDLFLQVNNGGSYTNALSINNNTNATFAGNIAAPGLLYDSSTKYLSISHWATPPTPAAILHISDNANDIDVPQIRIEGRESPGDTKLDIAVKDPNVRFNLIENTGDASNGYGLMTFKTNAAPNSAVNRGGFNFEIGAGSVLQVLTITNQGKVNIGTPLGTASSAFKLKVENADEDLLNLHNTTDGLDALISFTNPGGTLGRIQGIDNGGLGFDTGNNAGGVNSNAMFIDNAGKVGIGNTSPSERLEVDGNLITLGKTRGVATNYATSEGWVAAGAGAFTSRVGYFGGNFGAIGGGGAENKVEYDFGPFGAEELVWMTVAETGNNDDGGWNKSINGFANTANNGFMSVIYMRRDSGTPAGNFYHGCSGSATNNLDGSANTNPYFCAFGLAVLPADVWCVSIGIIYASGDASTTSSSLGGSYRLDTGAKIHSHPGFRQKPGNSTQQQRVYHYYSTSPSSQLDFTRPGWYVVDGTEPTLSEITGGAAAGILDYYLPLTAGSTKPLTGDLFIEKNTPILNIGDSNVSTGNARINFFSKPVGSGGNAFAIQFNKTASVDRLEIIDGSGNPNITFINGGSATFVSKVGIGASTVPTVPLDVTGGAGGASIRVKGSMSAGAYYYGFMHDGDSVQGTTQSNIFYAGGSVAAETTVTDWASLRIDAPVVTATNAVVTNNYGIYQASNLQKNFFNGNVGIGLTSPESKLQVDGGISVGPSATRSEISGPTAGNANMTFAANAGNVNTGTAEFIFTNSLTGSATRVERMRINSIGNVGIGDIAPTSISANTFSLSVNSSRTDLSGALITKANGTVKHQQYWDSSGYSFNLSAGDFQFNGANVGIGTTSPIDKLNVDGGTGDAAAQDAKIALTRISSTGNVLAAKMVLTTSSDTTNHGNLALQVKTTASSGESSAYYTDAIAIDGRNANVGIGTSTPNVRLDVQGTLGQLFSVADNLTGSIFSVADISGVPILDVNSSGTITFGSYNGALQTGAPTYILGTTATGDVVKTLSVPGASTADSLYDLIPNGAFATSVSLTLVAGVYQTVMSGNAVINVIGTFIVQMYVSDFAVGGTQYFEYYQGIMGWQGASNTNDDGIGAISDIALHRSGHAANQGITYLRTRETGAAGSNEMKLEVMSNRTYSAASTITFKFVRLI
jgi:hypothetical protein